MRTFWRTIRIPLLLAGLIAVLLLAPLGSTAQAPGSTALSGRVIDAQGMPVDEAQLAVYLNGDSQPAVEGNTGPLGIYLLVLPSEAVHEVRLVVTHPQFKQAKWDATPADLAYLNQGAAVYVPNLELVRRITAGFWIATLIFIGMLVLIITERLHTTAAALLAAAIVLTVSLVGGAINSNLHIISFERAIQYVDFEVIFLVLGMMIIVGTIERTGIFQWAAYQAYRISRGRIWLLAVILMLLTSAASALLDNVTTMLLVAPISLQIALTLGVDPLSLLVPEMLASNVGGISTLIGTPNNILIGSFAGLGFNDFLRELTPGVLLVQVALTGYVLLRYRKSYLADAQAGEGHSQLLLERLRENARITDPDVLRRAGIIFVVTLVLFVIGDSIHLLPAVAAMIGAGLTLLVVRADVEEVLHIVDWTTLLFFMALFMLIGTIQEVGVISLIASGIHQLVGQNLLAATLVTIWGTAMLCLLIPTIPLTAALLPVAGFLSHTISGAGNNVLYFSLSLGSGLGGNNSLIGATNNMVTAGIAQRAGFPLPYRHFLKAGLPATMVTLIVGTLWILIRF
jgi:Na+/H+ antiporter NhaD/arsenite permease-like protein